jgi:tRNA threonylcarbamoyladenosine biosynthesis protein TsaB
MSRLILAIDLSSAQGSLALFQGGCLVFEAMFQSERSHNACLFGPLKQALDHVGHEEDGLILVGTGPGSYTGVRISIAAAQGIALARGWQIIGSPSICTAEAPEYHVIGDARRGMFYHAQVAHGRLTQPPELLGASAIEELCRKASSLPWFSFDNKNPLGLPHLNLMSPKAAALARLSLSLSKEEKEQLSSSQLEPYYLQEAFITTARKKGKQVPLCQA